MATGKITNYGAAQVMNFIFGGALMNVPQTWYAAYCMGTCSPSAMGAEPTGAGYERKAISNTNAFWSPSAIQSKTNLVDILWNPAEANQGNVQAIVLYDSPVNGNPWFYGEVRHRSFQQCDQKSVAELSAWRRFYEHRP
jgi:hypothetical protein